MAQLLLNFIEALLRDEAKQPAPPPPANLPKLWDPCPGIANGVYATKFQEGMAKIGRRVQAWFCSECGRGEMMEWGAGALGRRAQPAKYKGAPQRDRWPLWYLGHLCAHPPPLPSSFAAFWTDITTYSSNKWPSLVKTVLPA